YNGGGAAIGDVNNDGLADLFLSSNLGDNKLYLNRGDFRFEDVSEQAGVAGKKFWSTGVALVDINADGWLDIYVCNAGYKSGEKPENELFINQGALLPATDQAGKGVPVFKEEAAQWGLNEDGYTTHAAFFDYDRDGDLDCYILNNSFMPVNTLNYSGNRDLYAQDWPVKDFLKGGGDKLLRNDGGHFSDVSRQAHIYGSLIGFGLGVTVSDINDDGWPDLYISNDFYERDYLYINQQDGTFREEIEQWTSHLSEASMGADIADVNNDGLPDIFTTEMLPGDEYRLKTNTLFKNYNSHNLEQQRGFYYQFSQNCLQINRQIPTQGGGQKRAFVDIARYAGVDATDWSWGALLFDMDGDGWRDIYVCNGIYKDVIDQDFIDFFADEIIQKMALTGRKEQINEVLNKMPSQALLNKCFRNTGSSL
ncbi:MAG TPA: VCBS repeat-containing protein, partial [Saprospiraceae bacterium]|nr:VCBS repeat-containing protein [Saprospiraceae bacterium]